MHLLDCSSGTLLRRIDGNDDGAENALKASDFPHEAQSLFQEYGREDGGDDNTQSAKWSDENGVDESIGDEIANLSNNHGRHAQPPPCVLEVSISFTSNLVVFFVGLEKTDFLDDKRDSNEETGAYGQDDADSLVCGGAGGSLCRCRAG